MTKKELLLEVFDEAISYGMEYIAVAIETRGSHGVEIIINPSINFDQKKTYYTDAYDDSLILKTFGGIRIVSACNFDRDTEFLDVVDMLNNTFKVEDKEDGNNNNN